MLTKAKTLQGYSIQNTDDETIGKVKEFYFDDRHWTVRYLVADTGNWLTGRQVLLSPYALVAVNSDHQNIVVDLTKKQLEDSPALETDKPVSHQFEQAYYGHYGYPMYWSGPCMWGPYPYIERDREKWKLSTQGKKMWDPHLRSTYSVSGHHIQALDGEVGHVEDFIIDDETWAIRYLIVDTHNWWPGKKVLISPQWIERVSWGERKVFVNLSRDVIKRSPAFTGESLPTRDYEIGLHKHYNRKGHWVDAPAAEELSHP
jgi:sporulation protein YlmC with PRC-barrel domain